MAVSDAHVFPGFLTPVLTQLFFPKPPTTFLTCLCRGERQIYARKKGRLNRGSNSQPPGHESDTLTTESPRQDCSKTKIILLANFILFSANALNLDQSRILSSVKDFNPLPHMPILGSSNSAVNKDMKSKIWTNGDAII